MNAPDDRFDHLLSLAREGHIEAAHDLWAEYGFDAAPHLPTTEENQTNNTHQEN